MNSLILSLAEIAQKKEKVVLGLMSGTSMDGLDLALCRIAGHGADTQVELLKFGTHPYSSGLQKKLRGMVSVSQCRLEDVCLMNSYLGDFMGDIILENLEEWGWQTSSVDCIASHGQSIYHAPASLHQQQGFRHATLQIGDGDHIARRTGILTFSDFRQKHTAAGGEGAPMTTLVDTMLFGHPEKDRLLLNIGGIANFTYLPAASAIAAPASGDTGPGNTLLDKAAHRYLNRPFDEGGEAARSGTVSQPLLEALKADAYFNLDFPKTTGPELFNWDYVRRAQQESGATKIKSGDLMSTLAEFTVETIVDAIKRVHKSGELQILVSGGGVHNSYLMDSLERHLDEAALYPFGEVYFNADAKEAVCFAILANETLSGKGFNIDSGADVRGTTEEEHKKIHMGKISFPD